MIVTDGTVAIEEDEIKAAEALNGKPMATNDAIDSIVDVAHRVWYDATSQKAVDVAIRANLRGLDIRPITNRDDKGPSKSYKLYSYMKKAPTADREYEDEVRILEEATNMAVILRGKAVNRGIVSGFGKTHKTVIITGEEQLYVTMKATCINGEFTCSLIMKMLDVLKRNSMFITDICAGIGIDAQKEFNAIRVMIKMNSKVASRMELENVKGQMLRISDNAVRIKSVEYDYD